jgi:hypothetical protein
MKTRALVLTFLLTTLIFGTASAITINQKNIGPISFQTIGGVPLTAWSALSAFKSALNPITKAVVLYQGIKAIAPSEVATLENNIISTLGYIIPGMELDHSYYPQDWSDPNTPPETSNTTWKRNSTAISDPDADCKSRWPDSSFNDLGTYGGCSNQYGYLDTSYTKSCSSGYILQSGTCTLNDPDSAKWPSDGKPTIMKDLNKKWQNVNKDPDQLTDSGIGTDTITRSGTDPHGNPTQETITSNPDGSTTYTRKSETIDQTTGQPVTNTTNVQMDAQGNVTNITENNQNNTTLNNSTTNIGNGTGTTKLEIPPITVSGDGGQLNKTLPQTETADQALTRLKTHLSTNTIIAPVLNPVSASGACPLFFSVNMGPFGNHSTNVMCELYEIMIPTLDIVTKFVWSLAAILIFFSA